MRVLLVDDEKEFVSALAERLSLRGITADWVSSGTAAVERASEQEYEAIVVDMKMPGISGQEVMKRIRAVRPETKFIVLTGHVDGVSEAYEEGESERCHHLFKPADIETLVEMLHELAGE